MSPVIILGLVVLWAVVLVPMWLRRHEEDEELRGVDQFSGAMRTLARREVVESAGGSRYVVMPHRSRDVDVHVSGASAADEMDVEPEVHAGLVARMLAWSDARRERRALRSSRRSARSDRSKAERPAGVSASRSARSAVSRSARSATERRRRTLLGLASAAFLFLIVAIVIGGVLLWTLDLVLLLATGGFVAHLRQRARQTATATRQRRRAAVARSDEHLVASEPVARPAHRIEPADPDSAAAQWVESSSRRATSDDEWMHEYIDEPAVYAEPDTAIASGMGNEWSPRPVPRPTYTMKPAAPARRRRNVPLADPVTESYSASASERLEDETDDLGTLDDILTHRRAVNE